MRNSLFNGLTEVCTMVGNMRNIPPVPCMGTPTHYGIYIQTYNFDTVLRDYMPRAKALGKYTYNLSQGRE